MKEWYEYDEFEDYWNEYVPTIMRKYTLEKLHRKGMHLGHMKELWTLHKNIVLYVKG